MTKIGHVAPKDSGFWNQLLHPEPNQLSTGLHGGSLALQAGFAVWAGYELLKKHDKPQSTLDQLGWGVQLLLCGAFGAYDLHQLIHAYKYKQLQKNTIPAPNESHHTAPPMAGRIV